MMVTRHTNGRPVVAVLLAVFMFSHNEWVVRQLLAH